MNAFLLIGILVLAAIPTVFFTPLGKWPLETIFPVGDLKPTDFESLVLTDEQSQFLVCPSGYCAAEPHAKSPEFEISVAKLHDRWRDMLTAEPRVEILARQGVQQYDYVQRSARFRFPDIITVRFIPLSPVRSTLAIYSRSVYGSRDLGVNRKRVEDWIERIRSSQ